MIKKMLQQCERSGEIRLNQETVQLRQLDEHLKINQTNFYQNFSNDLSCRSIKKHFRMI